MKFTFNKKEEVKKEIINASNLSNEEFENLINNKKIEIEELKEKINISINNIRVMTDENYLSNETLKRLIIDKSEPVFATITIILLFVLFFVPVFLPIRSVFIENKLLLTLYGIFIFGLGLIIFYIREKKKELFAENNYKKCQLFKSDFIELKTSLNIDKHDKNLLNYYVIFMDENNKRRKHKISKEIYNKYKLDPPTLVYVVKLPQYRTGNFYHSFNINDMENNSFLKEMNKNYIN